MTSPNSEPIALTYKEAAALLRVDVRRITAGVADGSIPSVQLGARKVIPRARLLELFGLAK